MYGRQQLAHSYIGEVDRSPVHVFALDSHPRYCSMVVRDLDVPCFAIAPSETDTPLIVDPNAVLPASVAPQRLKTIARR